MTSRKSTNRASHQPAQRRKIKTVKIQNSRHTTRLSLLWWKFCVQINSPIHRVFYVISFFLSVFAEIMHRHFECFIFSRFSTENFHNFIELRNLNFISCFNPMISFLKFHFVHRSALYGFSKLLSINSEDLNSPWISFLSALDFFRWCFYATAREIWIFWGANARRHTLGKFIARTTKYSLTVASSFRLELNSLREKETKREQRFFLRRWRWCWFEFYFHIHSIVSELRVARDFREREQQLRIHDY